MFSSDDELDYEDGLCDNCGEECHTLHPIDEVKLCYVCRMYYKLMRKHRPCNYASAINEFRQRKVRKCPEDMQDIANEFVEMAQYAEMNESDNDGVQVVQSPKTKCHEETKVAMRELTKVRSRAVRLECSLKAQRAEGLMNGLDSFRYLVSKEDRRDEEGSSRRDRVRGSHTWTEEERIIAFHCLLRYGRDFEAVAEVLGTKTSDKVKSFYTEMKADIDKLLEKEAETEAEMIASFDVEQELSVETAKTVEIMSSQHSSPVESTSSSIPAGAEAVKYNSSHHHRPASSRKLFVNHHNGNGHNSESSHVVDGLEPEDDLWEEDEDTHEERFGKMPTISSERLASHVDTMFTKLTEDMERAAAVYGDGSFFARNFETYDAEVQELGKLSEKEARAQLQRYALRCHVNEREKDQLHKRNRELSDAVEVLRIHIMRTQVNVLDQARRIAKQATDGLSDLQQTSSKEITKLKQKHALSLAQSNTLQNQLKQTSAQLEAKKEELKEANKHLDMLRFERDSLQNHSDQLDQKLEQNDARVHDLQSRLDAKEDALAVARAEIATRDQEIRELREKLKHVEDASELRVRRREMEITKQMDHYLEETKAVDAERERLAKIKIMELQKQLKLIDSQLEEAERRALAAEEKVADYEENLVQYRGQMEGEALRAITNGYRNALSAIPSSRSGAAMDRLFPMRSSSYGENIEPPLDPCVKPNSARNSRGKIPSRSDIVSSRADASRHRRKK
ncbi:hypothetical protein RB195_015371 [Necator americanus]|uniref:SANT domain-containing protein n=1 Tax=Necator americanus TaxID=51031 RepID=A0ABR1E4Q6_NECAM